MTLMFVGIALLKLEIILTLSFTCSLSEILFYLLRQHILSTYYVPYTALGTGHTVVHKTNILN